MQKIWGMVSKWLRIWETDQTTFTKSWFYPSHQTEGSRQAKGSHLTRLPPIKSGLCSFLDKMKSRTQVSESLQFFHIGLGRTTPDPGFGPNEPNLEGTNFKFATLSREGNTNGGLWAAKVAAGMFASSIRPQYATICWLSLPRHAPRAGLHPHSEPSMQQHTKYMTPPFYSFTSIFYRMRKPSEYFSNSATELSAWFWWCHPLWPDPATATRNSQGAKSLLCQDTLQPYIFWHKQNTPARVEKFTFSLSLPSAPADCVVLQEEGGRSCSGSGGGGGGVAARAHWSCPGKTSRLAGRSARRNAPQNRAHRRRATANM